MFWGWSSVSSSGESFPVSRNERSIRCPVGANEAGDAFYARLAFTSPDKKCDILSRAARHKTALISQKILAVQKGNRSHSHKNGY